MVHRIKVAFVNQGWDTISPPVSAASIPIWTYETAKRLAQDCKVVIYSRRNADQAAVETYEDIEYRRVSVGGSKLSNGSAKLFSKLFTSFRYLSSQVYYLPYALRVALDLRQQQCDIVHIHNFSQFVPVIRAFNPQVKIVLHMHCEWLSQFDRAVLASRLAQVDLITSCSDYITDKIKARFPEVAARCQTVYNGVDTQQFAEAQAIAQQAALQATENAQAAPNLLFVGRVSPEKGLHTLISAFTEVADKFPAAQLFVIGSQKQITSEFVIDANEDPLVKNLAVFNSVNYLQHLKNQLPSDIADRVIFTGQISHLELQEYFQRADILINPSVSEAFGMSLVEAMATSTPTIGTAVGGMPEIVRHGETGLIVPSERPAAMADAITQLLLNQPLRAKMGEAGRARAVETFSWQAIATVLSSQYRQLLSTEKPSDPPALSGRRRRTLKASRSPQPSAQTVAGSAL
ncbi:MAG: glycosyltransferase family 1 protein [Leptolyngbya foveolarum]|uniref:Glycosyltransferase family 1 protein n=1 Tax=Leptolyngbya foveolarum TaxID=47253 RepID=A0A2W4WVA9_9CYAN|nr:MAG: glycosyltransferase family 1 protein [Leptolyngbya foveolarum]